MMQQRLSNHLKTNLQETGSQWFSNDKQKVPAEWHGSMNFNLSHSEKFCIE